MYADFVYDNTSSYIYASAANPPPPTTHTHACTHACTNLSRVERAFIRQHVTEEAVLTDTDVYVDEDAGEELTQEHRGRQAHSTLVQPAARSSN